MEIYKTEGMEDSVFILDRTADRYEKIHSYGMVFHILPGKKAGTSGDDAAMYEKLGVTRKQLAEAVAAASDMDIYEMLAAIGIEGEE